MYLPEQFLDRVHALLGEDYENYLASFDNTYGQTLRVNRLKTTPADIIRRFPFEPIPWCENGFYYQGEERLSLHPYYYAGVYYLQEPSAMAPAQFLPVEAGDKVLDLCAAPGGKTTALAAKLQGQGLLVANDISASRCKALLKNMELAGVKNAVITCETPERLASRFHGFFDKILVDAPCSGEGMFRKEPAMAKEWSQEVVKEYAGIQKSILEQAAKMLRPGGMLLYSTCTYSPEENEQSVEILLKQGFQLQALPMFSGVAPGMPEESFSKDASIKHCRRFWSHRVAGEGQFAALLQKPGTPGLQTADVVAEATFSRETEASLSVFEESGKRKKENKKEKKNKKDKRRKNVPSSGNAEPVWPEEMEKFFQEISWEIDWGQILSLEERMFLLPQGLPAMQGIRQIRSGLYLGDVKKKRFEPSQALAMALDAREYPRVLSFQLGDERIERYLKGETIDGDTEDGWVLICVDTFPLGWGKAAKCKIKNKYYKGWRKV